VLLCSLAGILGLGFKYAELRMIERMTPDVS
jgi:hypothetical protein